MNLSFARRAVIPLVAVLLALSVFLLNGRALIYFDTAAYLDQGAKILGQTPPDPGAEGAGGQQGVDQPAQSPAATVNGGRSAVYALVISLVVSVAGLPGVVALNLGLIWAAAWLLARAMLVSSVPGVSAGQVAAAGILAGCLGALPFYVAYVMPDILAPILILMAGLLTIHANRLSVPERVLCITLALFAMVSHPSHLLLAPGVALLGILVGPLAEGRRTILGLGLVAAIALAGVSERLAFSAAADHFLNRRVTYLPFVTARLIDDGPGLTQLRERCPDPTYPTCALYEALALGTDPERYDAPNIVFSQAEGRGSFALLPDDARLAIADHQLAFVRDVVVHHPIAILGALARNTLIQLSYFSADMTVPDPETVSAAHAISAQLPDTADDGRLTGGQRPWARVLLLWHGAVYAASLATLFFLWWRRLLQPEDRAMIVVVLGGIILNALICGGISEPADRYGARVVLLLPMLAGMLGLARGWLPGAGDCRPTDWAGPGSLS